VKKLPLRVAPFVWRLTGIRFLASTGKLRLARAKLAELRAPEGYAPLKETYDALLASIAWAGNVTFEGLESHPPDEMLTLLLGLRAERWYWAPRDDEERYLARYIDYLEAAVLGQVRTRTAISDELSAMPVNRFFKSLLAVV
jgi:hypothetical protein